MYIFACASNKWQNNQRIDGGCILVEVEIEVHKQLCHLSFNQNILRAAQCVLHTITKIKVRVGNSDKSRSGTVAFECLGSVVQHVVNTNTVLSFLNHMIKFNHIISLLLNT